MANTWTDRYLPPDAATWHGRTDAIGKEYLYQYVKTCDLKKEGVIASVPGGFGLLGFCSDAGIRRNQGRPGAAYGPEHCRRALARLPAHQDLAIVDFGDVTCTDHHLEQSQEALSQIVTHLLTHQMTSVLIGGGHEIALAHYHGLQQAYPDKNIGMINFDAHLDLRSLGKDGLGNSGTPFRQIATFLKQQQKPFHYCCLGVQPSANKSSLLATAEELQVLTLFADEIQHQTASSIYPKLDAFLALVDGVYLTICMDVFAQAVAPGVSAPQPNGLYPHHVLPLLSHIATHHKVLGFDIAELSPPLDRDDMTAKLAAYLMWEFIHY